MLYDGRGAGSSDRDVTDFSLAARVRDLESVVRRVGLARFPLTGHTLAVSTAVAYAVNHPDRVSHLILSDPFAAGADFYSSIPPMAQVKAMRVMAEDQWQWFTLSLANAVLGFSDSDQAAKLAAVFREGMSSRAYLTFSQQFRMPAGWPHQPFERPWSRVCKGD